MLVNFHEQKYWWDQLITNVAFRVSLRDCNDSIHCDCAIDIGAASIDIVI
jgi:hypothetical protein